VPGFGYGRNSGKEFYRIVNNTFFPLAGGGVAKKALKNTLTAAWSSIGLSTGFDIDSS
jgi:hypothetical protein